MCTDTTIRWFRIAKASYEVSVNSRRFLRRDVLIYHRFPAQRIEFRVYMMLFIPTLHVLDFTYISQAFQIKLGLN